MLHSGFCGASSLPAPAPVLLLFAGVAQVIGGLFAFRRSNAFAAHASCCHGSFNTVAGITLLLQATGRIPITPAAQTMWGYFLCSFGFISLALMLASLKRNMVWAGLLGALAVGYTLVGDAQRPDGCWLPFLASPFPISRPPPLAASAPSSRRRRVRGILKSDVARGRN